MKGTLVRTRHKIYLYLRSEFFWGPSHGKASVLPFEHRISASTSIGFFRLQTLILAEI